MFEHCPYEGDLGWERLVRSLQGQKVACGRREIAEALGKKTVLLSYKKGDEVIAEGELGSDIFFILSGTYEVLINGNPVVALSSPAYFGELALVDPESKRTASIVTKDSGWLAVVKEGDFSVIAEEYPTMWHQIANEIINR